MPSTTVKKVVLAYSGGLDTSIILKWLQQTYGCEVVTFTADLGQGEELEPARQKALLLGIKPENIFIEDLREEFVRDYVFPMFRANALYEGQYLLGTSIARPLIAKKQIEIAERVGADAVSHGATGKGNDQVRFELGYYALKPDVTVIAPWREWDFRSREALIAFAEQNQIPIAKDKRGEAPFSTDANLLHTSSEGKVLEDPAQDVPDYVYSRTDDPAGAPDQPQIITVDFSCGDAVAVDGETLSPASLLKRLNDLGRQHGIGRLDLVENRFVGMKSRGMYETPGGTILLAAHRGIESITLDRGAAHLKDELMPKYAELIYNGFWFSPEREMLQAAIDRSQGIRHRTRAAEALPRQCRRDRPRESVLALRPGPGDLRGRQGRLRPARRRRLHPAQRAAAEDAGAKEKEDGGPDVTLLGLILRSARAFVGRLEGWPRIRRTHIPLALHLTGRGASRVAILRDAPTRVGAPQDEGSRTIARHRRASPPSSCGSRPGSASRRWRAPWRTHNAATALLAGPSHSSAVSGTKQRTRTFGSSGPDHQASSVFFQIARARSGSRLTSARPVSDR